VYFAGKPSGLLLNLKKKTFGDYKKLSVKKLGGEIDLAQLFMHPLRTPWHNPYPPAACHP
jgi:hypothetical protein